MSYVNNSITPADSMTASAINDALKQFPTAQMCVEAVDQETARIVSAAKAAGDMYIVQVLLPAVSEAIHIRQNGVVVDFAGDMLPGHDTAVVQSHIKDFLTEKGFTNIRFAKGNPFDKVSFSFR